MLFPAVPAVVLLKEKHVLASTLRADHTFRPTASYKVFAAVDRIGEVDDGVLKCFRFHVLRIARMGYFVKYIITSSSNIGLPVGCPGSEANPVPKCRKLEGQN